MEDRNAAFMEMARIDPKRAFQIQSDARDASLERLKGGQEALRIAASRLASTNDDNSYRAVLADLDAQLMPLGIDISKTVPPTRSEEHTSGLQSLMRISYAVFCLQKKK